MGGNTHECGAAGRFCTDDPGSSPKGGEFAGDIGFTGRSKEPYKSAWGKMAAVLMVLASLAAYRVS